MSSVWVRLPQVGWISVSEYIAVRLPLPGAVVTWFVTGWKQLRSRCKVNCLPNPAMAGRWRLTGRRCRQRGCLGHFMFARMPPTGFSPGARTGNGTKVSMSGCSLVPPVEVAASCAGVIAIRFARVGRDWPPSLLVHLRARRRAGFRPRA